MVPLTDLVRDRVGLRASRLLHAVEVAVPRGDVRAQLEAPLVRDRVHPAPLKPVLSARAVSRGGREEEGEGAHVVRSAFRLSGTHTQSLSRLRAALAAGTKRAAPLACLAYAVSLSRARDLQRAGGAQ